MTRADGWYGGVLVYLYIDGGRDYARITLSTGSGDEGPTVLLFDGPIGPEDRELLRVKRLKEGGQ